MGLDVAQHYEKYGPLVLRRCRTLLRDEALAQDALHDVFVQLLRHRDRLTAEAPSALLLRMATNVCLNRLRTTRRHPEDRDEALLLQIAGAEGEAEGRALAHRLLDRLFPADDPFAVSTRTIAVMHLVDGLTLEEVAREANLSVSGVRKRLRTLRARAGVEVEGA